MTDTFRKEYKPLTDEQKKAVELVKSKAEELMQVIIDTQYASFGDNPVNPGGTRESNLAKTNLEQAIMWAVKGITN